MRTLALLLCCGAALAQERAFVEVKAAKDAYYVGERIHLTLRFGCDRDYFRDHAVPLFAREMDVPVQIQAQLPGWPGTYDPNARRRGPTFALNEDIVAASSSTEETRDGRAFTVVEATWRTSSREPGDLRIAAPALRYAYATEFHEDFVSGRVAKDPSPEVVHGVPRTLRILPLPEEGRPPEFRGAVGRFTVSAEASPTSLEVGDTVRLALKVKGDGDPVAPRPDLPGFHVLGVVHKDLINYVGDYHLKLLRADVREIPAIPFAFFDPGPPAGYRVIRTDPIPLEVRGGPAPEPPAPPPAADPVPFVVVALLAVAIAAVVLWARARRRVEPPDPHRLRLAEKLAALRTDGTADALADFLALYLGCAPAAVIGPDLPSRLAARGMEGALAARVAAALERLVGARYGGRLSGAEEVAALLPQLEAAIAGAGSPP